MAHILIVDDMRTMQRVIQVYLMGNGHTFESADSGAAALEAMQVNRPDLVISDYKMPDLDGAQLCQAIRADPALGGVPVVLVSSADDGPGAAARVGAAAFVKKPIDMDELIRVVGDALGTGDDEADGPDEA